MEATKPGVDEMYCSSCGSIIKQRAEICVKCGVRVSTPPLPSTLSATLTNTSSTGATRKGETVNWYVEVIKKYAVFGGRARRKEYWYFFLFSTLASIILAVADRVTGTFSPQVGTGLLGGLYTLAVLIPSIAVGVRRMHDTDRSGWWLLLPIVNLVFLCQDSRPGENQYGPNPKAAAI